MSNGQALEELRTDGYVILRGVLPDPVLEEARNALRPLLEQQAWGKGEFFGNRTRRVHNLLAKTRAVDPLVAHPAVLGFPPGHARCASSFDCQRDRDPPGRDGSVSSPG